MHSRRIDPTHLALQRDELLPAGGIPSFKSAFGLEECGEKVEGQEDQRDHPPQAGRNFITRSIEVFGTHTHRQGLRSRERFQGFEKRDSLVCPYEQLEIT